jgi:hypothetical protein
MGKTSDGDRDTQDSERRDASKAWELSSPQVKWPDMSRFWDEFPQISTDSTDAISEDRER